MEEWRLTRWHARARLHFLGKVPTYAGPDLLGGKEEYLLVMAQTLERLGMLKPPRATDLRISALGREIRPDGLKRGYMNSLIMRGLKGWHASGCALARADARRTPCCSACRMRLASGSRSRLPPLSARQNISTRACGMDWEFLAVSAPQKRGEWEIDLPAGTFGNLRSGVLRAWAMDYSRHILYPLPGDQKFIVGLREQLHEETDGSRSWRHPALMVQAMTPEVSIVVPFFDEEENVTSLAGGDSRRL